MSLDFINGSNAEEMDRLYQNYLKDPMQVPENWRFFFHGFSLCQQKDGPSGAAQSQEFSADSAQQRLFNLVRAYRKWGHLSARLDPLDRPRSASEGLVLANFGFSEGDLDLNFPTLGLMDRDQASLRDILEALKRTYCGPIGVEYMDGLHLEREQWFIERLEPGNNIPRIGIEDKRRILNLLNEAELFERFLHTKYVGQKRFSLEGGEVLIPALDALINQLGELEGREVIIGMPHRGRLNVLANIMKKTYEEMFFEFEPNYVSDQVQGDGDVKYHKGFSSTWVTPSGRTLVLSLVDNPSHLEVICPLVEGLTNANQVLRHQDNRRAVIPVLIHGDAAFAGQGVVPETLNMCHLEGYRTGGTVHVVVNNQIGFTTDPRDSRSTPYCTDVVKQIQAPVFHVNADHPEAVVHVMRQAAAYRQTFQSDVVVDLVCFRRHGHNEGDEPSFTQPQMVRAIKKHGGVRKIYTDKLIKAGEVERQLAFELEKEFQVELSKALELARSDNPFPRSRPEDPHFKPFIAETTLCPTAEPVTAISRDVLERLVRQLTEVPADFTPHPKLKKLLSQRKDMLQQGRFDWAMGEQMAFGSLLLENIAVRLSGQDVRRGTFSHRHAALFDYETGESYVPLQHLKPDQASFLLYNSHLSEMAVLGFEFGFSLAKPQALVIWEAQFGDFANGAQVIIDQFISSSESKWNRQSDLVLFLPHGYEGQGPEHSSARLERYLQLCAENNLQVGNVTQPAQLFHLLRRQCHRDVKKPLILMTPKSALRHPENTSALEAFTEGAFQNAFISVRPPQDAPKRVIFCSGKIAFEVEAELKRQKRQDLAVIRLEMIYPFPVDTIAQLLQDLKCTGDLVWLQEEPKNMGAWRFVVDRFEEELGCTLAYFGRKVSASPSVGSYKLHQEEQRSLLAAVTDLTISKGVQR